MKIAICSDIHLEFGPIQLENSEHAEVLILSGDICTAVDLVPTGLVGSGKFDRYMEFFNDCSANFPHVVYVMGNHEHYHGDFSTSLNIIKDALKKFENIHVLEKETWTHGDHVFIGGTLWTDMNGEDKQTMDFVSDRMNDFRICKNSNAMVNYKGRDNQNKATHKTRAATLSPMHALLDHKQMMDYIRIVYEQTPPWSTVVVVGHHAPSKLSEHPRYKNDVLMNGAYNSNLDQFILDRPSIKLWTHGHTHEDFDYMICSTRVVCNPRGYINHESRADSFKLKFVEV